MSSSRRKWLLTATGVMTTLLVIIGLQMPAEGYATWSDRRLSYGVVGQKYWIGPDAETYHELGITKAVDAWNASSTPISYSRTTVKSSSRLDWTRITTNDGYCAVTYHYVDTTNIDTGAGGAPSSNWWWAKVQIRPSLLDEDMCGPYGHRDGVLAHEMGHAMGLAHVTTTPYKLMDTYIAWPGRYGIDTPQPDDVNGINHLY